ncbi:MAG: hypothetical protein HY751_01850 [Nitrospinae bacterium]|nr:hypothetical protein [Nitrospinota bacterium]
MNLARLAGQLVFVAGFSLFFAMKMAIVAIPILYRSAPVESDDAYSYIYKASQMRSCFFQDCPAMDDLREQLLSTTGDGGQKAKRLEFYSKIFIVYQPLQSLIINALHAAGLSWENAYNTFVIGGGLFLFSAIGFCMYILAGPGPAGIGLGLMSLYRMQEQGFHYISPSNVVVGMGFLMWGVIAIRRDKAATPMMVAAPLLLALHTIGQLYVVITGAMYTLLSNSRKSRRFMAAIASLIAFLAVAHFLPHLVTRPDMKSAEIGAGGAPVTRMDIVKDNWGKAETIIEEWQTRWFDRNIMLALAVAGLFAAVYRKRWGYLALLALLTSALAASLLHRHSVYPAVLFMRIWPSTAVLLTVLAGFAVWEALTMAASAISAMAKRLYDRQVPLFNESALAALKIVAAIAVYGVATGWGADWDRRLEDSKWDMRYAMESALARYDTFFNPEQPKILAAVAKPGESVIYTDIVSLLFHLSYGSNRFGAVLVPAVKNTPDKAKWIDDNPSIKYLVTKSPVSVMPNASADGLTVSYYDNMVIRGLRQAGAESVFLLLANKSSQSVALDIVPLSAEGADEPKGAAREELAPGFTGWKRFYLAKPCGAGGVALRSQEPQSAVLLRGVKTGFNSSVNWPWDTGLSIAYLRGPERRAVDVWDRVMTIQRQGLLKEGENERMISFRTDYFSFIKQPATVVDDTGYCVLVSGS